MQKPLQNAEELKLHYNNNNNNILHLYSAFFWGLKALLPILLPHQEIVTIISLHLGHSPAKRTPHQHLDCNIPHNRQVPDTLWRTKQIEIKYLAQGYKHFGTSGARTHGLAPRSPALFH